MGACLPFLPLCSFHAPLPTLPLTVPFPGHDVLQLMFSAHSRAWGRSTRRPLGSALRWLGRTWGRRLVEYQFPMFGWGCLPFTLVSRGRMWSCEATCNLWITRRQTISIISLRAWSSSRSAGERRRGVEVHPALHPQLPNLLGREGLQKCLSFMDNVDGSWCQATWIPFLALLLSCMSKSRQLALRGSRSSFVLEERWCLWRAFLWPNQFTPMKFFCAHKLAQP